jgi:large subunit ribosomal protein L1
MAEKAKTTKRKTKEAELIAETVAEAAAQSSSMEVVTEETSPETAEAATAKAGRRSAKAQREEAEQQQKAERKTAADTEKPKPAAKPARSKAERAGKKYREAFAKIDKNKIYGLDEALKLTLETSPTKFDASVEMHLNLGVDPRQADQNVRDSVVLPAGTGKTLRIAVLAEADDDAKAKAAGADMVGAETILAALEKEDINFDVLIAIPSMMARLGKYARLLGPRGLMPNPKSGTVTSNVAAAVSEAKAGKVEYRVDQAGIVHLAIGKVSFGPDKLKQNAEAVLASIKAAKPASVKGIYIKAAYLTTTMGPSIKLDLAAI